MRHPSLIAVHRGGTLPPDHHRLLAAWAAQCAERVLPLFVAERPDDGRPAAAIACARSWAEETATAGTARTAAVAAHAAARDCSDSAARLAARAAGHAAAVAHMADHELGAAYYAIRALEASGAAQARLHDERRWQRTALPAAVAGLVEADIERRSEKLGHALDL